MNYEVKRLGKFFVIEYLAKKEKIVRPDKLLDFRSLKGMVLPICMEAFDDGMRSIEKILEG